MQKFWKDVRTLVTGASGFKGAFLCHALAELGADVHGVVTEHTDPESAFRLLGLNTRIGKVRLALTDDKAVAALVNGLRPRVVFHLGAKALVPANRAHPGLGFNVNVMGTVNVLEACRLFGVERLLVTSTDHVFGDLKAAEIPVPVDRPVSWAGPYETSKAAAELATRCYAREYAEKMPLTVITRCSNVFGGGDVNVRRVVPLFISEALGRGVISLRYRCNGRAFLDAPSAVVGYIRAVMSLGAADRGTAKTFHFSHEGHGNQQPFITMRELADRVAELTGARVVETPDCLDWAPGENPVLGLDCSATRAALGWRPVRSFLDALRDLCQWHHPTQERLARKQALRESIREALTTLS